MGRIPTAPLVSPGAIQGDRLSMNAPDMSPIGRGIQQLGGALKSLGEEYQANQQKMDTYNANLALEDWSTSAELSYQQNLEGAAPDGSDFIAKQQKSLQESYTKVRSTITDPELGMKADMVFKRLQNDHLIRGTKDVKNRQQNYVLATTGDTITKHTSSGAIMTEDEYQDYFDNSIKPRIDSVFSDPMERARAYDVFGKQMRGEFLKRNPAYIGQNVKTTGSEVNDSLAWAAGELGTSVADLATVISYETGGTFSTSVMGGKGGNYMGLIQFGPEERKRYGAVAGQSFKDQMGAVVRYLKDRGFKPGMNIYDLYSTINAGTPGRYGASDGPGNTVKGHVDAMLKSGHRKRAEEIAGGGSVAVAGAPDVPSGGMWDGMSDTEWNSHVNAARAQMRGDIAAVAKDELSSLEATGEYTGRQIGADDFNTAFAEDGPARFAEYEDKRAIAKQMHAYQDMSEAQILADINTRTDETPTGEGAGAYIENLDALKAKAKSVISAREAQLNAAESRHNAKVVAANAALEMRDKDPAGYVFRTNDAVRRAWREFNTNDPGSLQLAISETISAQEAIGISPGKIQPLPTAQANEIVTRINDDEAKVEDRMDLLFSTVSQTENPEHQRAIMRQLEKAGAPSGSEVVYDAWLRNDMGAARRLFTAAVSKAENLPGKGAREAGFDDAVNDALAGDGNIGATMYGLSYSDPSGVAMLERDAALAKKAATIAMANGAAQSDAIAQAVKDIQGDGVLMDMPLMSSGGNVLGVVPADMNQNVLGMGMARVVPEVRDALTAMVADQLAKIGDLGANANILNATTQNEIDAVIDAGAFRNFEDGWGFFDARSNSFVAGRDGKPLTWTTKELMAMGMAPVDQAPDTGPVTDPLGNMQ